MAAHLGAKGVLFEKKNKAKLHGASKLCTLQLCSALAAFCCDLSSFVVIEMHFSVHLTE